MKIKFNKFERVAGMFVGVALGLAVFTMISVAVKRGWFSRKVVFTTTFDSAEGIHNGTVVQMSGLRAGSVDEVELQANNTVKVTFSVLEKFQEKIRQDSKAQLIRPFIIGDRVLEVSLGSESEPAIPERGSVGSHETMDLMSLLSGKTLGPYLETIDKLLTNLKTIAEAFGDTTRTESLIKTFDRVEPLIKNLSTMSIEVIKLAKQATKDENLGSVLARLTVTTREVNELLPALKEKGPHMAEQMIALVDNLTVLTTEFKVLIPALAEVAPDLPKTSRRAVEALNEAVVLLKAMQKSFFMRSNVEDVRQEEAKRDKSDSRKPASDNSPEQK